MDFIIVRCILTLFIFHSITSDTSEISKVVKEIVEKVDIENGLHEYRNTSLLSLTEKTGKLKLEMKKGEIVAHKLRFSSRLLQHLIEITRLRGNTTRQLVKMLYHIENLHYSMKKSLNKEDNPETLEDLLGLAVSEQQSNELVKSLNQLKTLKFKVYELEININSKHSKSDDLSSAISKFSNENSIPLEMSWNNANNEESLLKFDIDRELDELEKLRRLSLMVQDELNEMPKSKDEVLDHAQSESGTQNPLFEDAVAPRWILNEKDIEEIQHKYITWMTLFETSEKGPVKILKEIITKNGQSVKLFCKTLAEYFNLTSILLECTAQEDTECEKIILEIMEQKHFNEFVRIFIAGTEQHI